MIIIDYHFRNSQFAAVCFLNGTLWMIFVPDGWKTRSTGDQIKVKLKMFFFKTVKTVASMSNRDFLKTLMMQQKERPLFLH